MKQSIPFDNQLAQAIAQKHSLSTNTIRIWRHRNAIPEKYIVQGQVSDPVKTDKTVRQQYLEEQLCLTLRNRKLNRTYIAQMAGFADVVDLSDRIRATKRIKMSGKEISTLVGVIHKLKKKIKLAVEPLIGRETYTEEEKQLVDSLLRSPWLVTSQVMGGNHLAYQRHVERRRSPQAIYEDWEVQKIIDCLSVLVLELTGS